MSRPHLEEITDEMILSRMDMPNGITVKRMSARLQLTPERVRRKLLQMVEEGKIKREREGASTNSFFRYFLMTESKCVACGEYEIATPPQFAVLTGTMSGYDAEIARRQELCMSLRRFA